MGLEAVCKIRRGAERGESKVLLETDFIAARGSMRFQIPFKDIASVQVLEGVLQLRHAGATTELELGGDAEKWAARILNPKRLIDKLDVKSGSKVSVIRVLDADFWAQLTERTTSVHKGRAATGSDFVFVLMRSHSDLGQLDTLRERLAPSGAIWVVWAKGKGRPVSENDVRAAAGAAGLVDVKVAKFSETLSALKLVIPVAARKQTRAVASKA